MAELPSDSPEQKLQKLEEAMQAMRQAAVAVSENRIFEEGIRCEKVLQGLLSELKRESPPWPLDWIDRWWDDQVSAIRGELRAAQDKLRTEMPELIADPRFAISFNITTEQAIDAVIFAANDLLTKALPEVTVYRAERAQGKLLGRAEERLERMEDQFTINLGNRVRLLEIVVAILIVQRIWSLL